MTRYQPPRLLERHDQVDKFVCRSTEQTDWLRRHAHRSASTGSTKVLVVTTANRREVVAYYAWCMAQLDVESAPARLRKGPGATRNPWPYSPASASTPSTRATASAPASSPTSSPASSTSATTSCCRGLLIHAETDHARAFDLHLIPELIPSPTDDLHLVLLTKDARRTLDR